MYGYIYIYIHICGRTEKGLFGKDAVFHDLYTKLLVTVYIYTYILFVFVFFIKDKLLWAMGMPPWL